MEDQLQKELQMLPIDKGSPKLACNNLAFHGKLEGLSEMTSVPERVMTLEIFIIDIIDIV